MSKKPVAKGPPAGVLSDDYYNAIGKITVNAAIMDHLIDSTIWMVLKMPPERGKTITKLQVATGRKIRLLHHLVVPMIKDDQLKTEFLDVYCKLTSAQANRSKIVHAKWVFRASDQEILIEVPDLDDTVAVVEPMPVKQLQRYASEIARAQKALEKFFLKVVLKSDGTGFSVWPPSAEPRRSRLRGKKKS